MSRTEGPEPTRGAVETASDEVGDLEPHVRVDHVGGVVEGDLRKLEELVHLSEVDKVLVALLVEHIFEHVQFRSAGNAVPSLAPRGETRLRFLSKWESI